VSFFFLSSSRSVELDDAGYEKQHLEALGIKSREWPIEINQLTVTCLLYVDSRYLFLIKIKIQLRMKLYRRNFEALSSVIVKNAVICACLQNL
jgi:hypothetical protein